MHKDRGKRKKRGNEKRKKLGISEEKIVITIIISLIISTIPIIKRK